MEGTLPEFSIIQEYFKIKGLVSKLILTFAKKVCQEFLDKNDKSYISALVLSTITTQRGC